MWTKYLADTEDVDQTSVVLVASRKRTGLSSSVLFVRRFIYTKHKQYNRQEK